MASQRIVVVLDRHRLVAQALAAGLSARGHRSVAMDMEDGTPPAELPAPALVLLDAQIGWPTITAWLAAWHQAQDPPLVILMTDGQPPVGAATAQRAGVSGWLPRKATLDTATGVIRAVCSGRSHLPAYGRRIDIPRQRPALTDREQQVLAEIAAGAPYAEIAERLQVSHNTVRTHATSIRTKLGVRSKSAAVAAAHGVRLLQPADGRAR